MERLRPAVRAEIAILQLTVVQQIHFASYLGYGQGMPFAIEYTVLYLILVIDGHSSCSI